MNEVLRLHTDQRICAFLRNCQVFACPLCSGMLHVHPGTFNRSGCLIGFHSVQSPAGCIGSSAVVMCHYNNRHGGQEFDYIMACCTTSPSTTFLQQPRPWKEHHTD